MNPFERINTEGDIMISGERYAQLIRAEQDANYLKKLIEDSFDNYHTITHSELGMLVAMFIGKKEEE